MRILQVIHDFLPKHRAGAEIYTDNLCRELAARHKVHLFFTDCVPELRQYSSKKGRLGDVEYTTAINNHRIKRFRQLYDNPRMDRIFRAVLDSFNPDVVHLQHLMFHSTNYPRIAAKRGIPSVMTLHDFWPICEQWGKRFRAYFPGELRGGHLWADEPYGCAMICDDIKTSLCARCFNRNPTVGVWLERNLAEARGLDRASYLAIRAVRDLLGMDIAPQSDSLYKKIRGAGMRVVSPVRRGPLVASDITERNKFIREALSRVFRFISPSQFLAREMIRYGYPEKKFIVLDNGFRTDLFKNLKRTRGERVRFGYIGTVAELKGVHVLVKAFRQLDDGRASLHIFGDTAAFPDYSAWLKQLAGDSRVTFHGRFNPEDVADIYAQIDVLVAPSIWYENSPLVLHEAFLSGTPVIASRLGGMPDLVDDGKTGLLFEAGNYRELGEKMSLILGNPSISKKMAEAAPGVMSIGENARALERIYEDAIEHRGELK
jgi:glycosyltransferase involved in cell wall biosynthesis